LKRFLRSGTLALLGLMAGGCAPPSKTLEDWAIVRKDDLVLGVEVTGSLRAVNADLLGPPAVPDLWDYKVSFMAPEGASITKGQPVLGFDD
jgi:hypothetical protein